MQGKCIPARLEIMPNVLLLTKEYLRMHPQCDERDAYGAAYRAFREEMQRQTIALKEEILGSDWPFTEILD